MLKEWCFTEVHEHELVEMGAGGLDYSIGKKLDTQHLRDMAQLVDRVQHVEHLNAEKPRASKNNRKERVAYVKMDEDNIDVSSFDEGEVDMAELKQGPPYVCKGFAPLNGKTPRQTRKER